MKRFALLSMLATGLAVFASPAQATPLTFHVQVDTAPLIGNPHGPFYLDFALTDGSGTLAGPNSVVIDDFAFGAGAPLGSATLTGGATGNLSTSVNLSDNANFFNEFFQAFTPGAALGFDVTLTTNADPVSPDAFTFSILDGNLLNLTTTGLGDSLLLANISPSLSVSTIQTFSTTSPVGVTVDASAIPEPGTLLLLGTGILACIRRRQNAYVGRPF